MDLRVVLDTNILLISISNRSPYHWIYRGLKLGKYSMLISTEITLDPSSSNVVIFFSYTPPVPIFRVFF